MKESITKFDLESAFKALEEIDIPSVGKVRANRPALTEIFSQKTKFDSLMEEYYDVSDTSELDNAKEAREAEVAKAKLARIEKIVDLDADSPEDLLASYVGKYIMQCPQCMTLFYKDSEDIIKDENDPETVNVNEICQHCGNESGYTLIGKVGEATSDEMDNFTVDPDIDEPSVEELPPEEAAEDEDFDIDLEAINLEDEAEEIPAEEEEKTEESFSSRTGDPLVETTIYMTKARMAQLDKAVEDAAKEVAKYNIPMKAQKNSAGQSENIPDFEAVPEAQREAAKKAYDKYKKAVEARPDRSKNVIKYTDEVSESLTEEIDKELDDKLKAHNDYISYLQTMICQEEEAFNKANNKFIKDAIQRRLDAFKADLENALPEEVKTEMNSVEKPVEATEGTNEPEKQEESFVTSSENVILTEELCEEASLEISDEEFEELINSPEFKKPISDSEAKAILSAENDSDETKKTEDTLKTKKENLDTIMTDLIEINESALETYISTSLVEAYGNVSGFKLNECSYLNNKFNVNGTIYFNSGKTRQTTYSFSAAVVSEGKINMFGLNEKLGLDKQFALSGYTDNNKTFITEAFTCTKK